MSDVFVQMGIFYNNKEQPTVVMFKLNQPLTPEKISSAFVCYGNLLIAQHQVKESENRCSADLEQAANDERAANAILELYHKVANQPVLLEHVIASGNDTHNTIIIKVRKEAA